MGWQFQQEEAYTGKIASKGNCTVMTTIDTFAQKPAMPTYCSPTALQGVFFYHRGKNAGVADLQADCTAS